MNRKRAGIILLFMCFVLHSQGQTNDSLKKSESLGTPLKKAYSAYEITGKVTDKEDGLPVPYAPVYFSRSSVGTVTDDNGMSLLQADNLPSDSITVKFIGYNIKTIKIDRN